MGVAGQVSRDQRFGGMSVAQLKRPLGTKASAGEG